ncbi:MAG: DUF4153 domain-containing protein [Butyrivibrio sp.]|nr:DUF4153 domain-containing protein [Butyrivibrio sp.]
MKWYEKIKEGAKGVLKEHPLSISVFFIYCVLAGIKGDFGSKIGKGTPANVLEFIYLFTLILTPVLALCESNYAYKKKAGKIESLKEIRKSLVYFIVTAVGVVIAVIRAYIHSFMFPDFKKTGTALYSFDKYFDRIIFVYLAICVFAAIYFMYKKHMDSFEKYSLRAFLSLMKAGLVYGIILLGTFCILWVFNLLFFDLGIESMILWLVTGIVGFPASLLSLSMPGEKTTRFSEIVMGYVFPGILTAAFVIVYAYIIKILITWTFPSNQVFTIVTALFVSGLAFWTMALGCTEGKANSALKVMPLLFIPFIVIQIMCLAMRIDQYGITGTRYLGILLIVFEVIYEAYYIYRFTRKEGLGGILMPLLLLFVAVYFIIPGINVYAVITSSQKAVVDAVVNSKLAGDEESSAQLAKARSAYHEIMESGGLEGERYLKKLYAGSSKDEVEKILGTRTSASGDAVISKSYYVYAECVRGELDIDGYSRFCSLISDVYEEENELSAVPFTSRVDGTTQVLELDLRDVVHKLKELEIADVDPSEENALLETPIKTDNGVFYIEYMNFEFDADYAEDEINDLVVEGYYIYD